MPVDEFKKSVKLIYNMIKPDGLVYLNLINKKNVTHSGKFLNKYDFLIKSKHENKTIQSLQIIKECSLQVLIFDL